MTSVGRGASPRVLVLNGGSSSGKSSVARELQTVLDGVWLRLGVDTLVGALPPALLAGDGLLLGDGGAVGVGDGFVAVEDLWMGGVARMAELGARILVEDNFVSGPSAQERWRGALARVPVGWIGVHCDPVTAADRERRRGDRTSGMALAQARAVHTGIRYDLEVDTTTEPAVAVAGRIRRHFFAMQAAGGTS
ncbi:phosphotransferase-like protein [Blastococcus xanthinilyticus]|uniref:phosphotransferase-like protein n=1 Tax=Blastococcus xanthinilyticus TaxID=1564164 RepID=UPI001AA0CB77|nr:hypothetical protein [Blastococcus xanthinilyticus]